ncbi:MAG: GAF domain-containing protein, partial [Chloroflexota bacterium]
NNPDLIGADWSQLPEVKRALETGRSAISNQLTEPQTNQQITLAVVPVLNTNGQIKGLLAALIDIEKSSVGTISQMVQAGNTGYVEIVDGNGLVIARTEPGVPLKLLEKSDHPGRFSDLIKEGKAVVRTCHRCHEVNQEIQRRRDIIAFAPLSSVPWGVGIRQSEDEALAPTRQLEMRLLLLGVVLLMGALLIVWFLTQGVVKPLKVLKAAAQKVAMGDFEAAVPLRRGDEIGQLSLSFYTMTQELAKSRNLLLSRNKELTALNSISVAVSQSLDLKHLSETALQNVLEVTQTTTGCIFLPNAEGNRLELMISLGASGIFSCEKPDSAAGDCACYRVLRHRQTLMVNDANQCPMLRKNTNGETGGSFASIPLKSKDRVLGIMNVACSAERSFTESDFRLFNSIGFQVGLAMENSMLYSESKQKEELRGQLLSSIISAQEEERKRISRELHDESGQTLTAAIMNVESLESLVPAKDSLLREKIQGVKSLITHTLEDIRRLTQDLRPMALDDLGLASAIRAYVKNRLEAIGVQVQFESKGLNASRRLSPAIETALFRIIQEATNNIVKHADAHKVGIYLSIENEKIKAIVEDDGKGFEPDSVF